MPIDNAIITPYNPSNTFENILNILTMYSIGVFVAYGERRVMRMKVERLQRQSPGHRAKIAVSGRMGRMCRF